VIRNTLHEIHRSFEKLTVTELIPLPDNPNITIEYAELIGYELDGEENYRVGKLRKLYSVSELLNGIEKPENRNKNNGGDTHNYYYGDRNINTKNYIEGNTENSHIAGHDITQNSTKNK
jgi:hypothetical protein